MSFRLWGRRTFNVGKLLSSAHPLREAFRLHFDQDVFTGRLVSFQIALLCAGLLVIRGKGSLLLCFEIAEAMLGALPPRVVVGRYVVTNDDLVDLRTHLGPETDTTILAIPDLQIRIRATLQKLSTSEMDFKLLFGLMTAVRAATIRAWKDVEDADVLCALFARFIDDDVGRNMLNIQLYAAQPFATFYNCLVDQVNSAPDATLKDFAS